MDNSTHNRDDLMEKHFGIKPVDPSTLETHIGNTRHSDYLFAKQMEEANAYREKTEGLATADGVLDVVELSSRLFRGGKQDVEPDVDFVSARIPSADYTDPYPPLDDAVDVKQETIQTLETDEKENAKDITKEAETLTEKGEKFREDTEVITGNEVERSNDIQDDFRENVVDTDTDAVESGDEPSESEVDYSSDESDDDSSDY